MEVVVTTTAAAREGKIGRGSMYVVMWKELRDVWGEMDGGRGAKGWASQLLLLRR